MVNPYQVLAEHALRTLPDSIKEQKRLLRAVQLVLTSSHSSYKIAVGMLSGLETHETFQAQLPLPIKQPAQKPESEPETNWQEVMATLRYLIVQDLERKHSRAKSHKHDGHHKKGA